MSDTINTLDDLAGLINRTIGKDVLEIKNTMATKAELASVKADLKADLASVEKNLTGSMRGIKNRLSATENNVIGLTGATRELVDTLGEKKVITREQAKAIKQRHLGLPA